MPRKGLRKHFSAAANVCTLGIYVFSWRGCGKSSSCFWGSVEKALGGESGAFLWYLSYAVDVMQSIAEYCNGPVQRESCIHRLVSALKLTSFFFSPFPSSLLMLREQIPSPPRAHSSSHLCWEVEMSFLSQPRSQAEIILRSPFQQEAYFWERSWPQSTHHALLLLHWAKSL